MAAQEVGGLRAAAVGRWPPPGVKGRARAGEGRGSAGRHAGLVLGLTPFAGGGGLLGGAPIRMLVSKVEKIAQRRKWGAWGREGSRNHAGVGGEGGEGIIWDLRAPCSWV